MNRLNGLIHVAKIYQEDGSRTLVFLRKVSPRLFVWFSEKNEKEELETAITGSTIEEAIRLANREWKNKKFTPLACGFRYTLPERDEHGINALFHQMIASYDSMNGVYFDEELGHHCFVQNASHEAQNVWKKLKEYS